MLFEVDWLHGNYVLRDQVIARWSALGLCRSNKMYINISWKNLKKGPTSNLKIIPLQFINHLIFPSTVSSELYAAPFIKIYIYINSKNKADHGLRQEMKNQAFLLSGFLENKHIQKKEMHKIVIQKKLNALKIYYFILSTLGRSITVV
jgi:hypothetical protein